MKLDLRDFICITGLGGIGLGLWGYDPRLAFIVIGSIFLGLSFLGLYKKGK